MCLNHLEDYLEHSKCLIYICRRKERREGGRGKRGGGKGMQEVRGEREKRRKGGEEKGESITF